MKCKNCKTKIKSNQKFCPECGAEVDHKKTLSKKAQAFIACVCCLVLIISGTIGGLYFYNNANSMNSFDSNYIALESGFTGVNVTDEKSALEAISSVADVIGINNVDNELKISSTNTIDNDTYYRFQQYYNDIPVYGKSINMPINANGQAVGLTSNYCVLNTDLPTEATVTQADIEKSLKKHFDNQDISLEPLDDSNLVYYITEDNKAILAYELNNTVAGYTVFADANSGKIINSILKYYQEKTHCVCNGEKFEGVKTDNGQYLIGDDIKNIYVFNADYKECLESINDKLLLKKDVAQPMLSENAIFGDDGDIYSLDEYNQGVKLLYYIQKASDFYKNINPEQNTSTIGIINNQYDPSNAYGGYGDRRDLSSYELDCPNDVINIILGSDRSVNIDEEFDTIGHEFTHGVTDSQINWQYNQFGNSGALSEAYSDIFGELIEIELGNENWQNGERNISEPGLSECTYCYYNIRGQECPFKKHKYNENYSKEKDTCLVKVNYPNSVRDENYEGEMDCHINSIIISRAAYLMWNGIDGTNKNKISTDELAKLWYNSLFLMQSNPTFSQCRNAVELSARIMLKNNELNMDQYMCVCNAFNEVGIERAAISYNYRVNNDFNLKVLGSKKTGSTKFKLSIYKIPETPFDLEFFGKIEQERLVIEEKDLTDNKNIHLDDGAYKLIISPVETNYGHAQPITIKINVDGKYSNARNEVVVYTEFDDLTNVVLNKDEKDENLQLISGEYVFSAGVGAWSTQLNINDDFTFSGMYHDSELGLTGEKNPNGTVIICEFTGKFSTPVKIDDYTYKLTVESISLKNEDGYVYYDNGIEYECIGEPYGFDGCRDFYLYIKGKQTNDLSEDFLAWIYDYDANSGVLPCNCIRNPQTDVCFVKYDSTEVNDTEDTQDERTTVKESNENNVGRFYGNETAEQLRKSIIGSWDDLGSIIPEYNFQEDGVFNGDGKYSISNDKTLTISRQGYSEDDIYVWSSESWNEFYSHNKSGTYFWYMTDDGILKLNGKEKYRDGSDNFTYNSDGELMKIISGIWIDKTSSTEYRIYDNGTWEESTVYISYGKLINRKALDNGKVEIVDNTTAKLWQGVEHLNQIPGSLELIYDSENDKISVGGTNNTFTRAKYK